jgi:hypothetical protein
MTDAEIAKTIEDAVHEAIHWERERCALIAEQQAFYPDTVTGLRQLWVKQQIAHKIREGGSDAA